jgi:hypothetical protein
MPKRYGRKIKGGDLSSWWSNNVTNNGLMSRSKNYFSGLLGSSSPQGYYPTTQQPYQQTTNTQQVYPQQMNPTQQGYLPNSGGKKGTRSRRGGFQPNTPANNIASAAAPVSGLATARAHNWVGGKTKRRHHKHNKSCKHGKSCKYHKHSKSCKH